MIECGIFEHDITPPLGTQIPGYFGVRIADGILESLRCSAVCFAEDDVIKSVIVSADAIQVPKEVCDASRKMIAQKLNVSIESVTVHATHIHTGGPVLSFICEENSDYDAYLLSRIVDTAIIASGNLREVKLGFAKGFDDTLAHYRDRVLPDGSLRTNASGDTKPFGKIDPEITCLVIDAVDGSRYGVIVNYACHTDCVSGTKFSSDFPGAMRDTLRDVYGADFMPVFLNGFFGNLNHIDFEHGAHRRPAYYRSMGRKLAGKVAAAMEDTVYFDKPEFKAASKTITVKTRMPAPELLKWADETVTKTEGVSVDDMYFAKETLEVQNEGAHDFDLCLQVQKIGGVNLFACPREMFVEFEFMLKSGSDSGMNLCVCNANGGCGYVPIRELIAPGIYESRLNRGKLVPDAGYIMIDEMLALMKALNV